MARRQTEILLATGMNYPLPRNEARRLAKLSEYAVADLCPEPAFNRIVRLASRHFAMPMTGITFVDEFRVRFKAVHGMRLHDAAREGSCCTLAILQKEVLVVDDIHKDQRFDQRAIDGGPGDVRFYAGAPLRTADGCALGVLCVMDTAPREFTDEDKEVLKDMAAIVVDELVRRRMEARLDDEIRRGRQSQRSLMRQHHLLQRLSVSQEEHIRLRLAELTQLNESLHAEITGREGAETALHSAKVEAERANLAKSDFLLRMSHELRTPLNAILGFGQILQGMAGAENQRECATHVVKAGRHLLSLINEVLDIARIEAGRLDLSLEPVDVSDVVRETLDLIRPLAAERHITVGAQRPAESVHPVLADRQRLKQVLLNLLSNAVKYSPENGKVMVRWHSERGRTLKFSVSDTGSGITREQAARLFVPFERLGAEHSDIPGTGLGLALCKRLVEAMRGEIGVRTGTGRGSTFWVRLLLWQEANCLPAPVNLAASASMRRPFSPPPNA